MLDSVVGLYLHFLWHNSPRGYFTPFSTEGIEAWKDYICQPEVFN